MKKRTVRQGVLAAIAATSLLLGACTGEESEYAARTAEDILVAKSQAAEESRAAEASREAEAERQAEESRAAEASREAQASRSAEASREARYARESREAAAAQRAQQQQRQQQQQEPAEPTNSGWPTPPDNRYTRVGPFQSTWTCEQNQMTYPTAYTACFVGPDGLAYYYGAGQRPFG